MVLSLAMKASLALIGPAAAAQLLAPAQDINLPSSESATSPLEWLGANSPWFAGPNVHDISPDVPDNCYIDQAAYVVRHGSRYPDSGAYSGWVSMQDRFSTANYTARGSLSFLPDWRTVLTDPSLQVAMESPTGAKEAQDLGYTLRTRYPQLYNEGEPFVVWANNYTRVIQTAKMFVQGFLGPWTSSYGSVVSVTSKGFPGSVGNSLGPSDSCPNFKDAAGGSYVPAWEGVYVPPIMERLQALIDGNLTFTVGDITQMPYLCGFESQITGRLSPWCSVFTDEELRQYEYDQDLRYYYGVGPGTGLAATMMTPFLDSLVGLLQRGPGINGTAADGGSFAVPRLLASFLNDGQLVELVTTSGVFDDQPALSGTEKDDSRPFVASRFVSMRGTIAFERLNCKVAGSGTGGSGNASATATATATRTCRPRPTASSHNATYVRIKLNDAVYPLPSCKDGPGASCLLSDYASYVKDKYAKQGNWAANCNVTTAGAPTVVEGASFFTDLSSPFLQVVPPY